MNPDIITFPIAVSLTGKHYTQEQLKKYAYVFCNYCGKSISGDKNNVGVIKILLHPKCQPKMKKFHDKLIAKYNKKTKKELIDYKSKISQKMKLKKQSDRKIVLDHYSNGIPRCKCCGEYDVKFLTIDHVNNDGAEHRRSMGTNIYSWLIKNKFPPNFQVLCFNCNCAKGIYGECPHLLESPERKILDDDAFIAKSLN